MKENSLKLHGTGYILGMLRLCARPASGTRAPLSTTGQKELGQTENPELPSGMSAYRQWMTPDAIVIYPSWKRALPLLLLCGGFVAIGFFLYTRPDEDAQFAGLLCILVLGGAMIYPLVRLLRHTPTLIIHSSGVVDNGSALSVGFLPWHEMARVEIVQFGSQRYLAIGVKNRETLLRAQSGLKALLLKFITKVFGAVTYISSLSLSMPLEEIVAAIRERRRAAGHGGLKHEWAANSSE